MEQVTAKKTDIPTAEEGRRAFSEADENLILNIQDLCISLDGQPLLKNACVAVPRGAAIGIVGPSGIGKTTFIKSLIGALGEQWSVDWGSSTMFGEPVPQSEAQWHAIRGKRITYMAQDASSAFVPRRTMLAQLKEICKAIDLPWNEGLQRIQNLLQRLDLPESCINSYPGELSGGMLQRLALLVALLPKPDLLIADEPTASLDLIRQVQMVELLKEVTAETGCALLFVTHRKELLGHLSSHIYELKEGELRPLLMEDTCETSVSDGTSESGQSSDNAGNVVQLPYESDKTVQLSGKSGESEPLLVMNHVSITYNQTNNASAGENSDVEAVKDVSLHVNRGEWVGIIGPSGAGKSSIFKALCQMIHSYEGQIQLAGRELHSLSLPELGKIVQPIFQQPHSAFNPNKKLDWSFGEALTGLTKNKDTLKEQIHHNLEAVNLPLSYGDKYIDELSGGEGQRAAIVRALMGKPQLLLCDEITSALDPANVNDVLEYLRELKKSASVSGLIITHDLGVAQALCSRIYVMDDGCIVEEGNIQSLMENPKSATMEKLKEAFHYGKAH